MKQTLLALIWIFQTQAPTTPTDLQSALAGDWVGTLEYRDFSDPASSTKRVKLPTWLTIEPEGTDLRFKYTYDDGPAKVVKEIARNRIDPATALYTTFDEAGKMGDSYAIAGLAELRKGRGTLTLTGKGIENEVPVNVRTTMRIGRNILEITRETGTAGEGFAFRHAYTFIRAVAPRI